MVGQSVEFPNAEFTMLAAHLTNDGLLGIADITTPNPTAVIRQFDVPEVFICIEEFIS